MSEFRERIDVTLDYDDPDDVMAIVLSLRNKAARIKRTALNNRQWRMVENFADEIEDALTRARRRSR